jgi:hypothetical protein
LIGAIQFRSSDHVSTIREAVVKIQERKLQDNDIKLELLASRLSCDKCRTILRGKETGQWLTVMPSAVNGTELLAQEFRNALLLRYLRSPGDLQSHCDGCGQTFGV